MGRPGYQGADIAHGREDDEFVTWLSDHLNCSTKAQLMRWIVRYVLDKVPAAEFAEWVRQQSDAVDTAKYNHDDEMLQLQRTA